MNLGNVTDGLKKVGKLAGVYNEEPAPEIAEEKPVAREYRSVTAASSPQPGIYQ